MATSDKKRIAKNTLALYVRMFLVMAVSLYTSRVILDKLGVTNFGIYNSVGALVAMLGFLNNTLSTGTSRFLTFEIGRGEEKRLQETFSTTFFMHLFLGASIVLIFICGGDWFISRKLVIPIDSLTPAKYVFYLSLFTTFISITQVPYTSTIIAHENMNVYAYLGILEAFAKLGIAFAISLSPINRLVFYAILVCAVQFIIAMAYRIYCIRHYKESHLIMVFKKSIFKEMASFSGWNLLANVTQIFTHQGLVVLINMFFVPAVAAAQAIGAQISNTMMHFINNFRTAINPQIIKLYAAGQYKESQKLTLESAIYSFELVLLLSLPAILVMDPLLHLWLKEVPPYAVIFSQYIVARCVLGSFGGSLYTPMLASGELKGNSIAAGVIGGGEFILMYVLLKFGFSVIWIQYIAVIGSILFSFWVKPYILVRKIDYNLKDILSCYFTCAKVTIAPLIVYFSLTYTIDINAETPLYIVCGLVILMVITIISSSFAFMDKPMRERLITIIKDKLGKSK